MKRRNADTTTCPYCDAPLKLKGRVPHIRIAHPGASYQPTETEITAYKILQQEATAQVTNYETFDSMPELPAPIPPIEDLNPTSHLAIAIKGLLVELDKVQSEISELESRHPGLIEKRAKIKYDLEILEKANAAILDNANTPLERQLAEAERVARAER